MRVPSELSRLTTVRDLVRSVAKEADASDACTADLVQAVDEAATNAIIHGHAREPGWVEVAVRAQGDKLIVTIADDAPPFDPTSVPAPGSDRASDGAPAGRHGRDARPNVR